MAELNTETSEVVYQVFRCFSLPNIERYGKAIERETGLSQGQVGDSIRALKHRNLIEKGERSQAQYYALNASGIKNTAEELWGFEFPGQFTEWLPHYIENYCLGEEESSIEKMLVEDLMQGMRVWVDHVAEDPGWELELVNQMEEELGKDGYPSYYVGLAFDALQ